MNTPENTLRISFNFVSAIWTNLPFFKKLSKLLIDNGHEVHIITGARGETDLPNIQFLDIKHSHFFSIDDYHYDHKTPRLVDINGNAHTSRWQWDQTTAAYCRRNRIALHFDSSKKYDRFFKTPYCRIAPEGREDADRSGVRSVIKGMRDWAASADKPIKLGLDLHGAIDTNPVFFSALSWLLVNNNHEVHLLTGSQQKREMPILEKFDIALTHFFSITDHNERIGTHIDWDAEGNPHLEEELWDTDKGKYCQENGIDLHIDDSDIYGEYAYLTPYGRLFSRDSHRIEKMHLAEMALKK